MRKLWVGLVLLVLILAGCKSNKWDIDISQSNIQPEFSRFDVDLFSIPHDSIWDQIYSLEKKYGRFLSVYNNHVIRIGGTNQLDYDQKLIYFLTDPDIENVYNDVQRLFTPLPFQDQLTDAFKRYHYYFPTRDIPAIYTHISGFNQSVIVDSGYMSIALDKYLGTDNKYYQMLRTPVYQRVNMHPMKIPSDAMMAWAETEFISSDTKETLLGKMLYYGKLHVYLDAVLPNEADTLKWGFTADQLNWCQHHEKQMWVYLVENKVLFTSAYKDINKYINDAPFTATFSQESPGRTGRWIGYQIVYAYLKQHPEVSLQQLMENTDYEQILTLSKYKP